MKLLGVLGGMGPAASAEFMVRLTANTPARVDQDHIPAILWSDPRVPDRSAAILAGSNTPLRRLADGVRGLKIAGCTHIVIPCNTAHHWYDQLCHMDLPIIHIVDSVSEQLRKLKVEGTIGIMGTQGTIESKLYQSRMTDWNTIVPTAHEMDELVTPGINLVKGGHLTEATPLFLEAATHLISRGATAIVLGCTEIPLAVKDTELGGSPVVNSIDCLALSAIRVFKKLK